MLLVQALESPLLVAVAAGSVALPTLLKLADILVQQGQELSVEDGCLPVEVDLGTVGISIRLVLVGPQFSSGCFAYRIWSRYGGHLTAPPL